jgi:hypothetical protein
MSELPDLPAPGWPADVADEQACKFAGDFFATWMTTPARTSNSRPLCPFMGALCSRDTHSAPELNT